MSVFGQKQDATRPVEILTSETIQAFRASFQVAMYEQTSFCVIVCGLVIDLLEFSHAVLPAVDTVVVDCAFPGVIRFVMLIH